VTVRNNERIEGFGFPFVDEKRSGYFFSLPASRIHVEIVEGNMLNNANYIVIQQLRTHHRLLYYGRHKRIDFADGIEIPLADTSFCL
jgi:hypothetical protein